MPTWLKIVLAAALTLALLAAVVIMFFFEELPACAQADAIESRFAKQLAELQQLANSIPPEWCDRPPAANPDVAAARALWTAWRERVQGSLAVFDKPAIIGAQLVRDCRGSARTFEIKPYYDWRELSRAMLAPPTEWPAVSMSYVVKQRRILYQNRVENQEGIMVTVQLVLDLEELEALADN